MTGLLCSSPPLGRFSWVSTGGQRGGGLLGILIFLGGLALGTSFGWAQAASPVMETEIQKGEMEKAWFAHREFLNQGDWEKSQAELEKVYQGKLDQGIRNHYSYAWALIRESQKAAEKKGIAASDLLNYAKRMAPDFSEVPRARAGWLASQSFRAFGNSTQSAWDWLHGKFISFYNPDEALPRLADLTFWALLSFFLTFAGFSITLLVRHYFFFTHHLRHLIRLRMSSIPLLFLSFLFLFSPFFLGLGWMWLSTLWLLAFWTYGGRSDRVATLVLLGLLLLLPAGVRFHASLLHSLTGNGVPEILRANNGVWNDELYEKLLQMNRKNPRDSDALMALGLVEKRMGKYAEAEQRFSQGVHLTPAPSAFYNNLGNVFLVTNRLDQAMDAYQEAARLDSSRAEAYYNLGQAHLLKLGMKEGEAEFQRAKALDPAKISYHTGIASKSPNRMVIDRTVDPLQIWERVLLPSGESDRIARSFWDLPWKGIPLEHGVMGMAALLGLLVLAHLGSRKIPVIRHCERCGGLICPVCTPFRGSGTQCVPCQNAFAVHTEADPDVVRKKRAEVARYQARVHVLPQRLSWVLPGVGHLWRGRSMEGIVYLFILTLFGTRFIWWEGWVPLPLGLTSSFSIPGLVVTVFLFLLFYGFVQYRMKRIRLQEVKSNFQRT